MNKRGSHIGVMISFTVFIVFLIFLYSILEPAVEVEKDTQFILDDLKINLVNKISSEINITSLKINGPLNGVTCIEIKDSNNFVSSPNMIIKDKSNIKTSYEKTENILRIGSDADFFKIYESDLFSADSISLPGCLELTSSNYTLGLTKSTKYVSISKIIELKQKYQTEYELLKNELDLGSGSEFGFNLVLNNKTSIGGVEKNVSTSVYAEEISVYYIDESANILIGNLNIRTWG